MKIFVRLCVLVAISGVLFFTEICCSRHVVKKEGATTGGGLVILFLGISCLVIGILSCWLLSVYGYLP